MYPRRRRMGGMTVRLRSSSYHLGRTRNKTNMRMRRRMEGGSISSVEVRRIMGIGRGVV